MSVRQTVAPAAEPVTAAEAKAHCNVTISDDDTLIGNLIAAAREWAEAFTRRQLVTATWRLTLDAFPSVIEPPFPPFGTLTSISYVDGAGATQTLSASQYQLDDRSEPARIVPAYGLTWPTTRAQPNAVTVLYTAGYGDADDVPQSVKMAILLLVAHWYEHREAVADGPPLTKVPMAAESLLWPFRVLSAT